MDTGVTHRQHYVWRKYLSQWATPKSSEGMVYCEMFGQSKKRINLTKICLENDMYQLQKLNDEEIKIILYIAKTKIEIVDQSNEEWVRKNQEFFQMKEALLSLDHTEETKKKLEDLENSTGEELQSSFETLLPELVWNSLFQQKQDFLLDIDKRILFAQYLSSQYFRTANMRDIVVQKIEDAKRLFGKGTEIDGIRIWKVLQNVLGTVTSYQLSAEPLFKLFFLSAPAGKTFITSDQPIINLCKSDETTGEVDSFDLYYPISPSLALIYSKNSFGEEKQILSDEKN